MNDETKIDIALGMSVTAKTWKNRKWTWRAIADKLTTANHTNETFKEFMSASKKDQLRIKDVGGFVGGYLKEGRRKPENVKHRQLITLDIDDAHLGFWDDFTMMFDNAAVIHGTHKHTEKNPRYRLIIPLTRDVTPDQYVAIARYVAGKLGIELFDKTTFQTERLMFWPSTPKDLDFYAREQKGAWLDVDEVLDSYVNWRDTSSWPTAGDEVDAIKTETKKQEDPEQKKGIIGAFCRSYTISEAIETFLQDEYVEAGEDRYTYTLGSAAAGLMVYDDKFAYSHHGTDPCSGKLCNAFDLVRVHKFGDLDKSQGHNASVRAMEELCTGDAKVRESVARERLSDAQSEFSEDVELDLSWTSDLDIDRSGKYVSSAPNISLVLSHDPALEGAFKENEFDNRVYVMRSVPWREVRSPEPIKNVDFSGIRHYLESVYGITGVMKVDDALNLEFQKNAFHPIKDYLEGLEWDGVERIDRLLIDFFGADDDIYTREAIRKPLVAAVARIYRPGTKFDLVLTLVGARQGTGKSTFFKRLGKDWFSDSFNTVSGKEAFEQLQGSWLIEMAELSGIRKSEVEAIKHFITKLEDKYRPAYGRIVETFKRRCVFFATTNEKDFLRDPSGNRRFMPVDVHEFKMTKNPLSDEDMSDEFVDQIWAEAAELYSKGEQLYLSEAAEKIAKRQQRSHSQIDDRAGIIEDYLECLIPEDWDSMDLIERRTFLHDPLSRKGSETRDYVCIAEIWCECLGKDRNEMTRYNTKDINDILRTMENWEHSSSTRNFKLYGKQRYYTRKLL